MIFDPRSPITRAQFSPRARGVQGSLGHPSMRGFGDFGNFGGEWEDYCDKTYTNPEFLAKCKAWNPVCDPRTEFGKSCRGLPTTPGNLVTDILGSVVNKVIPPTEAEYEPMNLFRCQLYDPARFVILSGYSNGYPPALKRGGMAYMSMFTVSPQMFIPGIGGFWLAMDDAKRKGGEALAADQVLGALVNCIPEWVGFVIDFFLTGWGALAKKCLQIHARNMPEGDGKSFMTAIAQNYGSFTDAINDPSAFSRQRIYISIGESMVAMGASGNDATAAMGRSMILLAPVLELCMNGRAVEAPAKLYSQCFTTVFTAQGPVSVMNADCRMMLNYSSRAIAALVDVLAEIKVANIGPKLKAAADTIRKGLDDTVAKLSNPVQLQSGAVAQVQTDAGGNQVLVTRGAYTQPVNKSDIWKKAAIGAGTGLVVAGPPGAIGGAGIALVMSALKKGSTT